MKSAAVLGIISALIYWSDGAQTCQNRMDIALVVEDTNAIADTYNEYALKEFLSDLVGRFIIGKEDTHVAMQLYNDQTSTVFDLGKYSSTADAKAAILLTSVTHRAATAKIDSALSHTWQNVLTVANGQRSCFPTVVVLVSYSSYPDPNNNNKIKNTDFSMIKQLQNSGALVLVLGIGPNRDPEHLITLAGGLENYFDFSRFSDLNNSRVSQIATKICEFGPTGDFYPCHMDAIQADIVFVVDVSNGMNSAQNEAALSFMSSYLRPFKWGKSGVQAAMVSYSKDADVTVSFKDAKSHDTFMGKAQHVVINGPYGENRYIASALEAVVYHVLTDQGGYRPNVTQVVFIFSSECFNGLDASGLANKIRVQKGADIHLVTFSKNMGFWKQNLDVAGDASHLHIVPSNPEIILPQFLTPMTWRALCIEKSAAEKRKGGDFSTSTSSIAAITTPKLTPHPHPITSTARPIPKRSTTHGHVTTSIPISTGPAGHVITPTPPQMPIFGDEK